MNSNKLFIPEKIKVGFQERSDTYTKKLAYVIYYDQKNILRKETSWDSWRDHKIDPVEYYNEPTEGFVLNRGGGGGHGWHHRNEFIRVWDPRDFEFEIDVANLLFILKECDCSRGKGLEGKFVYAWDGTSLVLLPASCEDFKVSKNFTQLQGKSVSSKDLIPGATYLTRKQDSLVYVGKFDYYYCVEQDRHGHLPNFPKDHEKRYVFWGKGKYSWREDPDDFYHLKDLKTIATVQCETPSPDYPDLVDKYNKSPHGSKVTRLFLKEGKASGDSYSRSFFIESPEGTFQQIYQRGKDYQRIDQKYYLKEGMLVKENLYEGRYYGNGTGYLHTHHLEKRIELTNMELWAELESGVKIKVEYGTFSRS